MKTGNTNLGNRSLRICRLLHSWLGIVVLPLAIIVGLTGFYLNHRTLISPLLKSTGLKEAIAGATTRADTQPPLSLNEVMQIIQRVWPEVPVKSIRERRRNSGNRYIVRSTESGKRLVINARNGTYSVRTPYRKLYYGYQGEHLATRYYWKRILRRLHTGRIGGATGYFLADVISLALVIFAFTGGYVWTVTQWRKYQARKNKALLR